MSSQLLANLEIKNQIDEHIIFLFLGKIIDYHLTLGMFYSTTLLIVVIKTQFF